MKGCHQNVMTAFFIGKINKKTLVKTRVVISKKPCAWSEIKFQSVFRRGDSLKATLYHTNLST